MRSEVTSLYFVLALPTFSRLSHLLQDPSSLISPVTEPGLQAGLSSSLTGISERFMDISKLNKSCDVVSKQHIP